MPLPFILGGIALAAAGYGAKKGYDGYQDKSLADDINKNSKQKYNRAKNSFNEKNDNTTKQLEELGNLQLKIGSDFSEFRKIAEELLRRLNQYGYNKDLKISIPQSRMDKIKDFEFSATSYLSKVVGAGMGGAAAAYAVYGGVMAFAAASTGTPIAALSGVAAYNATLAAIGGGSLAAGGLGMAGGTAILGSVVAAPVIAIAGIAYASYAEKALAQARENREETEKVIDKLVLAEGHLGKISTYVNKMETGIKHIYQFFDRYFDDLKAMDVYIRNGGNIKTVEDTVIRIISNGYQVAAILTDIITIPLFKPKLSNGEVIMDENKVIELEKDENGMQVINENAIDEILALSSHRVEAYSA